VGLTTHWTKTNQQKKTKKNTNYKASTMSNMNPDAQEAQAVPVSYITPIGLLNSQVR